MIIRLPKEFFYSEKNREGYAYVENGILFVKGHVNYEDLMYKLEYALDGDDRCYFCKVHLTSKTRTIDHLYPRRWGGVSIPKNMLPCCKKCNQEKKDMTYRQFQIWKTLKTCSEKEAFYQECVRKNLQVMKKGKFVLKRSWISEYDISEVIRYISFDQLEENKSEKLSNYYNNWHQYPHPIIVSSNDWVFKGKHILHHAKEKKIKKVPAIILENVIVLKKL